MISTITLEAEGFTFSFEVNRARSDAEYVDMIVLFKLDQKLGNVLVRSEPTSITTKDLLRLVSYFENHVAHLEQNSWSASDTFVNTELGFQIQALAGEILSPGQGGFSIICMVNIGKSYEEGSSVYVGGEAFAAIEQITAFTSNIRALLGELETPVGEG